MNGGYSQGGGAASIQGGRMPPPAPPKLKPVETKNYVSYNAILNTDQLFIAFFPHGQTR